CAATAGGTASGGSNTCTAYSVMPDDATGDICPANWRLPTGGATGEFAWLNAKMNNPSASSPSTNTGYGYYQNWKEGPWHGVLAGMKFGASWRHQGEDGYYLSSSHNPSYVNHIFGLHIARVFVDPDDSLGRDSGFAVRCILKY
ncbi:fibrobacter succinogenes major paralogous domain-containing protein, partial [Candidatus Saccharibacteria bacterium]|nr:fibrobacter succinogenes major paralogous domain-containing protein [Candidatus Saccharibacteria bacterium]